MTRRHLVAWLMAVGMALPALAQEAAEDAPYPDYSPAQDRLTLRYSPEVGATRSYRFVWSFDLDVPLSGKRQSEGEGVLYLHCASIDESGVVTLEADFEGFRNRMDGATYNVDFPKDGLTLLVDPSRQVVWTSEGLESIGALLMRSFFAVVFPGSRLEVGTEWSNELSLMDGAEKQPSGRPSIWPRRPSSSDVLPDDERNDPRRQARHVLAAVVPLEDGSRAAGVISNVDVTFSLEAYGLGTKGQLGVEMHSEYLESTGELRWARATGAGRLQTLAVVSVPVTNLVVVAAQWDPRTGESVEALAEYHRPLPPPEVPPPGPAAEEEPTPEPSDAAEEPAEEAPQEGADAGSGDELPPDHPLRRSRTEIAAA